MGVVAEGHPGLVEVHNGRLSDRQDVKEAVVFRWGFPLGLLECPKGGTPKHPAAVAVELAASEATPTQCTDGNGGS